MSVTTRSESAAATDASILLVEAKAFSVEGDSATWWVDNGAAKHVSNNIEYFTEFSKFESPCGVKEAGKEIFPAVGAGKILVKSKVDGQNIVLSNVWYVPGLYHERWGHQDKRHVRTMLQREMGINVLLKKDLCEPCVYGKAHRLPFGHRKSSSKPGEVVSLYVCGPFSESFEKKGLDDKDIRDMLQAEGTTQRLTAPYTPEQNGGSEREFRTCIELVRTFKYSSSEASFPEALYAKLVATATDVTFNEIPGQCEEHVKLPMKDIERPSEGKKNTQDKQKINQSRPKKRIFQIGILTMKNRLTRLQIHIMTQAMEKQLLLEEGHRSRVAVAGREWVKYHPDKFKVTAKKASYFLGLEIERSEDESVKICQQAYAKKILERFGFQDCKAVSTPMTEKPENSKQIRESDEGSDFPYRQAVRA
ncbi:hypothetical protein ILUMI_19021, partial [Ignelater luminosus]